MKVYRTQTWRDGRSWNATTRVEDCAQGGTLIIGDGHGTGPDPAEAAHDSMIAAELALHPPTPAAS